MADLDYDVADGVGTITLNRPHRKNAFTFEMIEEWAERLRLVRTDDDVRVVVLTGAGDAFCSGVDLESFSPSDGAVLAMARALPSGRNAKARNGRRGELRIGMNQQDFLFGRHARDQIVNPLLERL